ncbi:DMT family transporter [Paenibacillus sp. BSR1-1]|uniref:DMT family transporter n=1 Tax=Paenibacillus sp. BSR1-1 TaxID=3020845 RepID=UPI0025B1218B|nr:DMT family transporter [Paenibacillus sp. BSR1-1]MDN3018071.1 DMT family transporter [Paenibacillus sp. BSR1-1]
MNTKTKGSLAGLISAITWALDTVFIGVILAHTLFVSTDKIIFLAPLISTYFHDAFSAVWVMIYMAFKGELKNSFAKMMTRSGRYVMLAALMGGPVGMTCYVLAVKYIGASYTASISAVYPAVGALFAFLWLKDKLSIRNWIGLFVSILFIFILGYSSGGLGPNATLGFIFALGSVFGWGMECVICAYGMKDDVTPEHALQIRQVTSALVFGLIIIPIFGGYAVVGDIIMSKEMIYIASVGLCGAVSYLGYYKAINEIGPTRAMALNITYVSWTIFFGFIFFGSPVTAKLLICSVMIIVGSIITVANPDELNFKKLFKKAAA